MKNMIPKERWEEIKKLYQSGDPIEIARESGIPESTMYLYFKQEKCPLKAAKAILKFYKKRKQELKALLDDGN